jgi:tryptophan-rich sensory protein
VRRIIYLGGLGEEQQALSKHLRSRHEVGQILRESGAQVIEFRASIVIGSGSLSFELIRALVEKLPVMLCPKWVSTPSQPIAIEDLLSYLLAAIDLPHGPSDIFEIGGPDQVSYSEIMQEYARQRGLKRWLISVPFLSPRLSSLWLGLVTPVYARVGRKLVDSLRNPTVVTNSHAREVFAIQPRGVRAAIARALVNEDQELTATRWSDALSSSGRPQRWGGVRFGTRLVDSRCVEVAAPIEAAFAPIQRIGGRTGWYYGNWLWRLRGWLDLLVGGVGMRRERRDAVDLRVGDPVDCWRVESLEPNRRLRLVAEMKLPGRAWLEFEVEPTSKGSLIRQTAIFDPVGLTGLAYWYTIYPLHKFVFSGMLNGIAMTARHSTTATTWQPTALRQAVLLLGFIAICFAAAGLGAAATATSVGGWYQTLAKPSWNPPDWLFGPVWSVLYFLMAVAAWLVWRRGGWSASRSALTWFGIQLALNVLWSVVFFGLQQPGFAFAEIIALWLAILATMVAFRGKSVAATILMVPYLAWSTFAAVLNFELWRMNS